MAVVPGDEFGSGVTAGQVLAGDVESAIGWRRGCRSPRESVQRGLRAVTSRPTSTPR